MSSNTVHMSEAAGMPRRAHLHVRPREPRPPARGGRGTPGRRDHQSPRPRGRRARPGRELESLVETAHLLRSPKDAERLLTALRRALARKGKGQTLEELR